jgi:hypothetical protein
MSQTSYSTESQLSRAKGKAQVNGTVAPAGTKPPQAASVAGADHANGSISSDAIAKRAYEKFVARGGGHGSDQEDWAEAERELSAASRGR